MGDLKFTMKELTKSDTATKYHIANVPTLAEYDEMLKLIYYCLQPLREKAKRAMIISSGYRSVAVNKRVGGVATSQHCKGQAVDFKFSGWTVEQGIDFIKKSGVPYDQLINEYGQWIHLSYNHGYNRKQFLVYK